MKIIKKIVKIIVAIAIFGVLCFVGISLYQNGIIDGFIRNIKNSKYQTADPNIQDMYNSYLSDNNIVKANNKGFDRFGDSQSLYFDNYVIELPNYFMKMNDTNYVAYDDSKKITGAYVNVSTIEDDYENFTKDLDKGYIENDIKNFLLNIGSSNEITIGKRNIIKTSGTNEISDNVLYRYPFFSNSFYGTCYVFHTGVSVQKWKNVNSKRNIITIYENVYGQNEYSTIFDNIINGLRKTKEISYYRYKELINKDKDDVLNELKKIGYKNINLLPAALLSAEREIDKGFFGGGIQTEYYTVESSEDTVCEIKIESDYAITFFAFDEVYDNLSGNEYKETDTVTVYYCNKNDYDELQYSFDGDEKKYLEARVNVDNSGKKNDKVNKLINIKYDDRISAIDSLIVKNKGRYNNFVSDLYNRIKKEYNDCTLLYDNVVLEELDDVNDVLSENDENTIYECLATVFVKLINGDTISVNGKYELSKANFLDAYNYLSDDEEFDYQGKLITLKAIKIASEAVSDLEINIGNKGTINAKNTKEMYDFIENYSEVGNTTTVSGNIGVGASIPVNLIPIKVEASAGISNTHETKDTERNESKDSSNSVEEVNMTVKDYTTWEKWQEAYDEACKRLQEEESNRDAERDSIRKVFYFLKSLGNDEFSILFNELSGRWFKDAKFEYLTKEQMDEYLKKDSDKYNSTMKYYDVKYYYYNND